MTVSEVIKKMVAYSEGNLHDINHFMKVYAYAKTIAEGENLNPELQKEWDKLINKERYRARQEKICGQADYRRCNGDCFVCPWRKEGIVVSYETEHFAEGFGNDNAARGYGVVNCESTLEEKYIAEERYNTLCARICRYADSAYPDGVKIIACYLNGETLESTAKELHLTVRAVHYRLHQMLKYIREHRSTFCDF
jgi:hypothetical protein